MSQRSRRPRALRAAALVTCLLLSAAVFPPGVAAESTDPALYAVGSIGASNLYTTYFLLGTLADGYATAAYTAAFAEELTRNVIALGETSIDVLRSLAAEESVAEADRLFITRMVEAHELLIRQAWGLLVYVEDPSQTADWFRYRLAAWALISDLLGLE